MRYIDADALRERMLNYYECVNDNTCKSNYRGETLMAYEVADMINDCIDNAPTVNVLSIEILKARGRLAATRYQLERIHNGEICGTCDTIPFGQGDVCVKCLRHHIGKLIGKEKSDEM